MRLRKRDLKTYIVKRRDSLKEEDGTTFEGWTDKGIIKTQILPAGGRLMAEMYGERLAYMLTAYMLPNENISESDGVCIYVDSATDPDYKVVAIRDWESHKVVDLERIDRNG